MSITTLLNIVPGFKVEIHTDREQFSEAIAQSVAGVAYKATKATVLKGWDDSEKVIEAGQNTAQATRKAVKTGTSQMAQALSAAQSEAKKQATRVALATGEYKAMAQVEARVSTPVNAKVDALNQRKDKALSRVQARIDAYCVKTTTAQVVVVPIAALPEGKRVAAPKLSRKKRTLSNLIAEEATAQ